MGLTYSSVGTKAVDSGLKIKKQTPNDKIIALAGNPNVGKSTIFNSLTGLNQHTGNWPGKTVSNAHGYCQSSKQNYIMVDIPGTYSLMAHSAEEEVARNFICFSNPDAIVVVCDATCLERNMNLVLQTLEISSKVIVCINLMDEAKRKKIKINTDLISRRLKVPVVATSARKKGTLKGLVEVLDKVSGKNYESNPYSVNYPEIIENAISIIEDELKKHNVENSRWIALKLLDKDDSLISEINKTYGNELLSDPALTEAMESAEKYLLSENINKDKLKDMTVSSIINAAEKICSDAITYENRKYCETDRVLDRLFTGKVIGYPAMILLLMLIFWLTISGANYPSKLLSVFLFAIQDKLTLLFNFLNAPIWLHGILVLGMYRVLAWVVSVMLPPMAIFFPLFTLLEDAGYLPRIAYNLDKPFKKCCACGKQALTMCMGFGCNAAGIVGCRIIDSPRERLLAILTNNFVPCNGRFPALISIITMFFIGTGVSFKSTAMSAVILTAVIIFGIAMTFFMTKILSKTILKGIPSSFTLELPPYRIPQVGKVIVRSVFDRTLFVLGRAAAVAAPAGAIIWIMANLCIGGESLLIICSHFLDPFARIMGLDGIILMAFILGFPANEIVIPIIIMAYSAAGSLTEMSSLTQMKELFVQNGWTWVTAANTMLFSLLHWPCSTTLITVKKETASIKWTLLAALIPTAVGILVCTLFTSIIKIFV